MTDIVNPYLNLIKLHSFNYNDLNNEYKNLYVICNKTDDYIDPLIYNYYIDKNKFNEINKKLILFEIPFKLLKNLNHMNKLMILKSEQLDNINSLNYKLNEITLVLLILNIKYNDLKLYLSQFEQKNDLIDIYKLFVLNKYFCNNQNNYRNKLFLNKLLNIEDANYWTNPYNCKATLNKYFVARIFNVFNKKSDNVTNYLEDIYKTREYIDPSKLLTNNDYNYKIFSDKIFTKQEIFELFELLDEKQKYLLFSNLLISKKYCHLVLNNKAVLILMKPIINKFIHLFRYLIGYAWIKFYFDESIKKIFMTKNDNFIFDINTACELPYFPFSLDNPKLNPYMPILINDDLLYPSENIGGICNIKGTNNLCNKGLCNLEEFERQLNIFTTGNSNTNLFQNINWKEDKIAISGSIMTACLQKQHPLVNLFSNFADYDERMIRYFNEYYALADIDTMILTNDVFEFMKIVQRFYNQIIINVCSLSSYAEPDHIKLNCEKICYLFISEDDVLEHICYNSREKLIVIKKSIETKETILLFKNIIDIEFDKYQKEKKEKYSNIELEYPDYFDYTNLIYKVRIFQNNTNTENKRYTNLKINYKYKIHSPHLRHAFEVFMVNHNDFFATVQTFHLPCVRSYYDGNNVYLTPSCISAHMTYMNIDYKYFAGSRNPVEIINKYRMRGFGTWLNKNEKQLYSTYTASIPYWNNLYNINIKNEKSIKSNYGSLNFDHKLFQPRLVNEESYIDACPIDLSIPYIIPRITGYIKSRIDIIDEINFKYNLPYNANDNIKFIDQLQTINSNGNINCVEKWVIDAVYNIQSQESINNKTLSGDISSNLGTGKKYDLSGVYNMTG
jgi:hypothetical protein